ncbi:hypothetical protein I4U23_020317 [Adineta vaga]|nr:hypothetical protein I4U23_020317 [Adineta vaga]
MGHEKSKFINTHIAIKHNMMLTSSHIRFICQQTNLVDKEVYRRHAQFVNISKDGKMAKQQFDIILQEIWPTGNPEKLSNFLFNKCDKKRTGFIGFTEFIILHYKLNDDKSYLGYLFDMFDIREKGYLSRDVTEQLFASMFEHIGHPVNEQSGANISQQHITHLMEMIDKNKHKRLLREQFINIGSIEWTDEENGTGTLLTEQLC